MKRKSRYNSRLGKLFFVVPVIIIGSLVVYAFIALSSPGTLIITAENSYCATSTPPTNAVCSQLKVEATVDGKSVETPTTLSLAQGNYVVNFTTLQWYSSPASRDVAVLPGQTVYAVAAYYPIGRAIQITPSGFNGTIVTALHGVTMVNFTNPTNSLVTLLGPPFTRAPMEPGQTFSYIYPAAGTYEYSILSTSDTITVDVS